MPTIFTRIIDGEIPGTFVWRDDRCVVFMSINPMARGHALVVPIEEVDHWIDLDTATVSHLLDVAARLGRAQLEAFGGERVGLIIQGFEVPHAHVHVFAARGPGDFDLAARSRRSPEELAGDAEALRAALGQVAG